MIVVTKKFQNKRNGGPKNAQRPHLLPSFIHILPYKDKGKGPKKKRTTIWIIKVSFAFPFHLLFKLQNPLLYSAFFLHQTIFIFIWTGHLHLKYSFWIRVRMLHIKLVCFCFFRMSIYINIKWVCSTVDNLDIIFCLFILEISIK